MKKVVYISYMPLSEKVERDWYLSDLSSRGVEIAYWDITRLLSPGIKGQESLEREYVVTITDYQLLKSLIAQQNVLQTNFVMMFHYEGRFNHIFTMLTRHGCRLFFFEWGNFPVKERSNTVRYLKKLLKPKVFFTALINQLRGMLAQRSGLVKQFDVVFAAGMASIKKYGPPTRIIPINLCDYDNYLLANDAKRLVEQPYAVFLDINLAFQSDLKIVGWDVVDPTEYERSLCRFFSMVEERFGVEVVIAAHPKACYLDSNFDGRKVLKGVSPELAKDAKFIISHHSTSISYAVLNSKPLLFIYTEEMKKIYAETVVAYIQDLAEYLGQPVVNVDEVSDAKAISIVKPDPTRYSLYKYNYLTNIESEGSLNQEIVFAELTR